MNRGQMRSKLKSGIPLHEMKGHDRRTNCLPPNTQRNRILLLLGFIFLVFCYLPDSEHSFAFAMPSNPSFSGGSAVALPSIQISNDNIDRKIYGGKGDMKHLGGFTELDLHGVSPSVWKLMISYFGVRSLLDVGCGKGISTSWFYEHGVDTHCVEGSHDAVTQSILPDPTTQVTEHDFSRGPWWPEQTVDAVWCVEFTEVSFIPSPLALREDENTHT